MEIKPTDKKVIITAWVFVLLVILPFTLAGTYVLFSDKRLCPDLAIAKLCHAD